MLAPSVKEDPKPAFQLVPPLVLYSQVAPTTRLETLTVPSLVTPSELLDPVSFARAKVGAAGETVLMSMGVLSTPSVLVLPTASLKAPAGTEMVPLAVELGAGVNVAVYTCNDD